MGRIVESDIQADSQESSPYNAPEVFDESSHSQDSYVREIHEAHCSKLISYTPQISASPCSLPQHTVTPTSSADLCMSTSSTTSDSPIYSAVFSKPTRSTAPEIPTSFIVAPLSETDTELSEESESNLDTPGPSIPSLLPLPFSPGNSSDVSDTEIILNKCSVRDQKCSRAKCCPECKQPIHAECGQSVEGVEGNVNSLWCISCWIYVRSESLRKGRISPREGKTNRSKGWILKQTRSSVHSMWAKISFYQFPNLIRVHLLITAI